MPPVTATERPQGSRSTLARLLQQAPSRPLIGTNLISPGSEWTELCGHAGFDFVCVDQMVSAMSWEQTSEMLRGAAAGGTSGWVRLSAYPWGGDGQQAVLQRDVLKAIAIGAEGVLASVDNTDDAAAIIQMPTSHDRHRKFSVRGRDAGGILPAGLPTVIPLVESDNALADLSEFASIPGIEAVFLGVGDLARLKGITADAKDPRMAEVLRGAVKKCAEHGVIVMCSTGKPDTLDEVLHRIEMLWEIGIQVIWVPNPSHLAFSFYRSVVESFR